MREFTKAAVSFTWALSLFGVKQAMDILTPQSDATTHPATDAFNKFASSQNFLGDALRMTFQAGDRVQRSLVDQMFALLPGTNARDGGRENGSDACGGANGFAAAASGDDRSSAGAAGWGPVPGSGDQW